MSPMRHEGDKKVQIDSWGSHVDRMIREAQARGEFDNLPGAGAPLRLEDNVFAGSLASAYHVAKNAGAAPLWVQLDKEIGEEADALRLLLERMARSLAELAARAPADRPGVEAERQRVRRQYLARAADLDKKIEDFNVARPRTLSWLEKPRLPAHVAAGRFDRECPSP